MGRAVAASAGVALCLSGCGSRPQEQPAELVLRGGHIVTLDDQRPEAEALAVRNGIVAVGSNADIAGYLAPSTQILDLGGQFAMPGFIEGHGHFTGIGDPIRNYYAAVTRKVSDGRVFYGAQAMSRMDALRAYTINNAFAAFEEDLKGTLAVGKLADITVLTKDITTVPDEDITQAKVAYTIIGGKVAYRAP